MVDVFLLKWLWIICWTCLIRQWIFLWWEWYLEFGPKASHSLGRGWVNVGLTALSFKCLSRYAWSIFTKMIESNYLTTVLALEYEAQGPKIRAHIWPDIKKRPGPGLHWALGSHLINMAWYDMFFMYNMKPSVNEFSVGGIEREQTKVKYAWSVHLFMKGPSPTESLILVWALPSKCKWQFDPAC